jgi:hypothetical protein
LSLLVKNNRHCSALSKPTHDMASKPKTIDEYRAALGDEQRAALLQKPTNPAWIWRTAIAGEPLRAGPQGCSKVAEVM